MVLGLLLGGCVNKKEKALENCADDLYVNYSTKSFISLYHDRKNPRIIGIAKTYKTARTQEKEAQDKSSKFFNKNYFDDGDGEGLKPIYFTRSITSPEERKSYENAIWAESKKLSDKANKLTKETNDLFLALAKEKASSAYEIFWKAKLIKKIKVNEYYQAYKKCEKDYTESPDAFVLRWND